MARIELKNLRKSYGAVDVIKGIDLEIPLRRIHGLRRPVGLRQVDVAPADLRAGRHHSGDLSFDGERVNNLVPSKRGIAMVFQSYALYPHMKVYDNMAFGMKLAKSSEAEIRRRVMDAARLLQIEHLLDRLPKQLSGGQRQRVAIGRAIVRDPRVFLFDEPLSNLDAALRVQTRLEIARLHHAMNNVTMIYVTHDQVEAMTLADRICVLRDGLVEQVGTPPRTLREAELAVRRRFHRQPEDEFPHRPIGASLPVPHARHPLRAHRGRGTGGRLAGHRGACRRPRLRQLPVCRNWRQRDGYRPPAGQIDHSARTKIGLAPSPDKLHRFDESGHPFR